MGVVIEIPVLLGTDAAALPHPLHAPAVLPRQRRLAGVGGAADADDSAALGAARSGAGSVAVVDMKGIKDK